MAKAYYQSYQKAEQEELGDREVLFGPNGFYCLLGEPEDRIFCRDLKELVHELNNLRDLLRECYNSGSFHLGVSAKTYTNVAIALGNGVKVTLVGGD
jgi:hypothetical protein